MLCFVMLYILIRANTLRANTIGVNTLGDIEAYSFQPHINTSSYV